MNLIKKFQAGSISNSISLKLLVIGFLLVIFIPILYLVEGLVEERESRQNDTVSEVSSKWGTGQTIIAPILVVPYTNALQQAKFAYCFT